MANPVPGDPNQIYTNQCDSHGTYVAGVVGAKRETQPVGVEGVAPGVQLKSVRVTNTCTVGSGQLSGLAYTSGVLAAISWIKTNVPNNGVDAQGRRRLSAVANMSIVWAAGSLPAGAIGAMQTSIQQAVDVGVFFSFAAGNSNENACNIYPGALGRNIAGAMSVGAMQSYYWQNPSRPDTPISIGMDERDLGGDPALKKIASSGPCVEIWAPGRDVEGAVAYVGGQPEPGAWGFVMPTDNYQLGQHYYAPHTGSSLAAPHVAGAALLVARRAQMNGLSLPSPAGIETTLRSKTKDMGFHDPLGIFPNAADKRVNALTVDQF